VECAHGLDKATSPGRTPEDWGAEVGKMAQLGAKATDDEFNAIADYLAQNFPASSKTNVNQAPESELTAQLGLTDKEAASVVQYRRNHGSFVSLDDLKKVPGLDAKKLDTIKDRIAF
jgi:competence protein ComEA